MASFNARGGMRDLYIHPVFRRRKGVIRMVEVAGITGGEDGCSWRMRPDRGPSRCGNPCRPLHQSVQSTILLLPPPKNAL